MLVSMKLRTLMQLVAVEAPPLEMPVAFRAQAPKFGDLLLRLVLARQLFQIVAYQLIQALAHGLGNLACLLGKLFIDRQGDVHGDFKPTPMILHILCVNRISVNRIQMRWGYEFAH
jgi:hypothetical protein